MSGVKRYQAFSFFMYNPSGGWDDRVGGFDTIEEAVKALEESDHPPSTELHAGHVVDIDYNEIVLSYSEDEIDYNPDYKRI